MVWYWQTGEVLLRHNVVIGFEAVCLKEETEMKKIRVLVSIAILTIFSIVCPSLAVVQPI
jgi:hypothetical protein